MLVPRGATVAGGDPLFHLSSRRSGPVQNASDRLSRAPRFQPSLEFAQPGDDSEEIIRPLVRVDLNPTIQPALVFQVLNLAGEGAVVDPDEIPVQCLGLQRAVARWPESGGECQEELSLFVARVVAQVLQDGLEFPRQTVCREPE